MPTSIPVSEARSSLSDLIADLATTGPVILTRHNDSVAVLAAYDPDADKAQFARYIELNRRADKLVSSFGGYLPIEKFSDAGFDTLDKLSGLINTLDRYCATYGVEEEQFNIDSLIDDYPGMEAREFLASVYLGPAALRALEDRPDSPVEWMEAFLAATKAAIDHGDTTDLVVGQFGWNDDDYEYAACIRAHATPAGFLEAAKQLIDQDVTLASLTDAFGNVALPADILAKNSNAGYEAASLAETGMPLEEIIAVLRADIGRDDACTLFRAGITTGKEIKDLIDAKTNISLVRRATRENLPPETWKPLVAAASRYAYTDGGVLPLAVLAEAASQGLTLLRWDNDRTLPGGGTGKYSMRHAMKLRDNLDYYPWLDVYPNRVIDLAKAGIAPGYIDTLHALLHSSSTENYADLAIELNDLGLTHTLAKAMSRIPRNAAARRQGRGAIQPTADQLRTLLRLGLTVHQTDYLVDHTSNVTSWITQLQMWNERQEATTTWLTGQIENGQWAVVELFRDHYVARENGARSKSEKYLISPLAQEGIERLGTPKKLHLGNIRDLLSSAAWVARNERYAHGAGADVYEKMIEKEDLLDRALSDFSSLLQSFEQQDDATSPAELTS